MSWWGSNDDDDKKDKDEKVIKVTNYSDKSGAKIDIYDKHPSDKKHDSIHLKVYYEEEKWESVTKIDDKKEEDEGDCFLTTATLHHYKQNFDDDCYELNLLRWFRDKFVSKEEIEEYYNISPQIVTNINNTGENAKEIYKNIYHYVIESCISDIENEEYESAYNKYKISILTLSEEFASEKSNNKNEKSKVLVKVK